MKKYECRVNSGGYKDDKYILYDQGKAVEILYCVHRYPAWLCEERILQLMDAMKRPDLKRAKSFTLFISQEPIPDSFEISYHLGQEVTIPAIKDLLRNTDARVSVWLGISLLLRSMGGTVWVSFGEAL